MGMQLVPFLLTPKLPLVHTAAQWQLAGPAGVGLVLML
jgi:hypothetical protein